MFETFEAFFEMAILLIAFVTVFYVFLLTFFSSLYGMLRNFYAEEMRMLYKYLWYMYYDMKGDAPFVKLTVDDECYVLVKYEESEGGDE